MKVHSPQDHIYGPLMIPSYCWPIIDSVEFQRLRFISQLGAVFYVYPCANHTRFEHSLGCCHLASVFMNHITTSQPELKIEENHIKAVVIAALCHDLGHGPFSHDFDPFAKEIDPLWSHENMSGQILRLIVNKYKINIPSEVIDAACNYICGEIYDAYPPWLSQVVCNNKTDIDIDKFDYLSRDNNRTLSTNRFEYDRLIVNCKVIDNQLAWKLSEVPTIECLFYTRNDMHIRVYKHRVVQSIGCMIRDIFYLISDQAGLETALSDPTEFVKLDDNILYKVESGKYGEKAQQLAERIRTRKLYKLVGEIRIKPENLEGESYSQRFPSDIATDIADVGELGADLYRVVSMKFRYGLTPSEHPLLSIPFWQSGNDHIVKLQPSDISCIVPAHFKETAMRIFISDKGKISQAKNSFLKWKERSAFI
ncbi:HD domain containing protein [Tritrichomonas foetus]|uniref:HD domain containing protein n=1 Tax=Tritrichomonas foetus TaxID=1144522 RepID=A0A1J4J3H8_9EUKA|nr:HD domain containing protein [Tritrichomonas foetus]|eukprot:OHS94008.1 HD domain containing protein [Tritrichomonas foetus]